MIKWFVIRVINLLHHIRLKNRYGKYSHWRYIDAEKKVVSKIPNIDNLFTKKQRKECFMKGFNSDKLVWYDLSEGGTNYITDYEHFTLFERIDQRQYYVADDKLVCERMLAPFCKIIPTIGYIVDGKYFPIGDDKEVDSYESFVGHVRAGEEFYIKPNFGGSGRGIGRLTWKDGCYWWNDSRVEDLDAFIKTFKEGKGYLVQRRFMQTGFSHDVNPDSVNTVRVVTMLSPSTGEPFIAGVVHRFGRKGAFVDNIAKGNIVCPVDKETGKIKYAILSPTNGKLEKIENHPDTNIRIAGEVIPQWDKVKELCFKLAKQLPFMPLCGWDIIPTTTDVYMQELNYNPDIYLVQLDKPLLYDKQVKEFYDYYKKKYGN